MTALDKAETKCAKDMQEDVKTLAQERRIKSSEELLEMADGPQDEMMSSMEKEVRKAEYSLSDLSESKQASKEEVEKASIAIKQHYETIKTEAETGSVDHAKVADAKESMIQFEEHACAQKQSEVSSSMRKTLRKLKAGMKSAAKMSVPTIGMRGFGGFATSLVGGYGF